MCKNCFSVFSLSKNWKTCDCGVTKGKYTDEVNAVYENGVPIGFANNSISFAVKNQPKNGYGLSFSAFVIAKECETFKPNN